MQIKQQDAVFLASCLEVGEEYYLTLLVRRLTNIVSRLRSIIASWAKDDLTSRAYLPFHR